MRTHKDRNKDAKAILDRLTTDLERNLRIIESGKRQTLRLHCNEQRAVKSMFRVIRKNSGHLDSAVPTSGREARQIRSKLDFNPRMSFGLVDFQLGLTSQVAREEYRLDYDVNHVIRRYRGKKKMKWPSKVEST